MAATRDHGFSLEPDHFCHLLADRGLTQISFYGKPYPEVFQIVGDTLNGIRRDRIAMCGDTLHTDILGAAAPSMVLQPTSAACVYQHATLIGNIIVEFQ
ncbi:MAG: HAD hydrolase-like protein [Marinibacterium sp.]|nr:HAD hydrolase-like protein [Marinibacterium sp.]